MTRKYTHETNFQIGETTVLLRVEYSYVLGYKQTWEEPDCRDEIDIHSLEWSMDNPTAKTFPWHKIEGVLFDLIAEDECLCGELCQAITDAADAARADAERD